jgi:dihydroorotase
MKLLIQQATVHSPASDFHQQIVDILVDNGFIINIGKQLHADDAAIITAQNLQVSDGFVDVYAQMGEPGLEQKETLASGTAAAQKGGYTEVLLVPNTLPCVDNKSAVVYLKNLGETLPVKILPIGAITIGTSGAALCEMIEMHDAGAVAFGEGMHCLQNASLMVKALQYIKKFEGTLIQMPFDASLTANGFMNEGIQAHRMGVLGIPAMAEELMVARDIELCSYTNSKLHLTGISTAKSVALVKAAKQAGVNITCSATPYHALLTDAAVDGYNTAAKVNPPLRTADDVAAIQAALLDGTIDHIASHHSPHEIDAKQCEFANAQYGMSTIEHCFNAVATIPNISAARVASLLSSNVRNIFGLNTAIKVGAAANITAFTLDHESTIAANNMLSAGKNTAFDGAIVKGKILATIYNNHNYIA